MSTLYEQYEKKLSELKIIMGQINELENSDILKKYFDLCNQKRELESQRRDLYKKIKFGQYSYCNHIWVNTLCDHDRFEGRHYDYYGCIKCGLDERVFYKKEKQQVINVNLNLNLLTPDEQIMYDFMKSHDYIRSGIKTSVLCDLDLAKAIYFKIKEAYPNIDDNTARKYFEIALYNIRENVVNDKRKESRAQRLLLSPNFKKWYRKDVTVD